MGHNQIKLSIKRIVTLPIRVLSKAGDMYVRTITSCADKVTNGSGTLPLSTGQFYPLSRSFSTTSSRSNDSDHDHKEFELYVRRVLASQSIINVNTNNNSRVLGKSSSVGMGRIDEDKPCEFFEEFNVVGKCNLLKKTEMYNRSRSYAVVNRTRRSDVF